MAVPLTPPVILHHAPAVRRWVDILADIDEVQEMLQLPRERAARLVMLMDRCSMEVAL